MKQPDPDILRKTSQWLRYAQEDLRLARHGLTMKSRVPYRLIAYHAQQCAEKSLKAYLVYHDVDFPYTHNISHLVELGTRTGNWGKEMADAEELTPFAVSARYPGEEEDVTKQEALRAVSIAGTVRRRVLDKLLAEGLDERLLKHLK